MKRPVCVILLVVCVACCLIGWFSVKKCYSDRVSFFELIDAEDIANMQQILSTGYSLNWRIHSVYLPNILMTNPTPLIKACKTGNVDVVKLFIDNGADVNMKDNFTGETPLYATLNTSNPTRYHIAFMLIEAGANYEDNSDGRSVLMKTLLVYETDTHDTLCDGYTLLRFLVSNGVDLSPASYQQNSLTHAVRYSNNYMVRILIDSGAIDVNSYDKQGNTALITAVKWKRADMVQLLLEYDSNVMLSDANGRTAYDYACDLENTDILSLLQPYLSEEERKTISFLQNRQIIPPLLQGGNKIDTPLQSIIEIALQQGISGQLKAMSQ